MSEPRPCEVNYSYETKKGNFIQFGNSIYFDDGNNPHAKTIAIVELENGQVAEVDPHMVKFINKPV